MPHAARLLTELDDDDDTAGLLFVHFPIGDGGTRSNEDVLQFCIGLCDRICRGEVLYVHCWGGHGRTGTIVAILLGLLYDMTAAQALEYTQMSHLQRRVQPWVGSPETSAQRVQVEAVIAAGQTRRLGPPAKEDAEGDRGMERRGAGE